MGLLIPFHVLICLLFIVLIIVFEYLIVDLRKDHTIPVRGKHLDELSAVSSMYVWNGCCIL
jgi:hypothetical protein